MERKSLAQTRKKGRRPSKVSEEEAPLSSGTGARLGFEATLFHAADKLRNNMDAAEYKHVVLGLVFLKYVSDAFEERRAALSAEGATGADPEDPEAYRAEEVFWVPESARWSHIQASAKLSTIGEVIDEAMAAIARENPSLEGILPDDYARHALDKQRLGELVELIGTIGLGARAYRSRDVLGRVYEYFLGQFAAAEGKRGGQFYTPQCIVRLLVEMVAPYRGRVFDPCCGSGGMFVQSETFVSAHGGGPGDVHIYGQESNYTTYRLAKLNLAIRGIDANIAWNEAGSLLRDAHEDLRADYVLANPPFNDGDWGREHLQDDPRFTFGLPPPGNANFAWVQHFVHHLAPNGQAAFVLSNGSMSSHQSGEGEIRRALVEADLVDCVVSLPEKLFYSTQIPVCIWILARNKSAPGFRDRRGQTLFIDARELGTMVDRVHAELGKADIERITTSYHAFRSAKGEAKDADVPGFARSASLQEIHDHRYSLVPGRYVGFARRPGASVDRDALHAELEEIAHRFERIDAASRAALDTLRGLIDG